MATKRAIALAEVDQNWRAVFAYQQGGHYEAALSLIDKLAPTEVPASLLARLYSYQLQFLISAGSQILDEALPSGCKDIVMQARKFSYYDIVTEAWLVCYDMLVTHRQWTSERLSECVRELVKLEGQMDGHASRRWLRRKASYLRKCGQLTESAQMLTQLVRSSPPPEKEDADNSLCLIYFELGRLQSQLGRYLESAETYTQALTVAFSIPNRTALLIRLANVLERLGHSPLAEVRRAELFNLWGMQPPMGCRLCGRPHAPEGRIVLPCCRDLIHCECLVLALERQATPAAPSSTARCPSCGVIVEIVDLFLQYGEIRAKLLPPANH